MHLPRDEPRPECFEIYACQCYHRDFVNPAAMAVYTDYMNELAADIEKDVDYPNVCARSTIEHSDPLVATEGELNPHSTDFEPDEGDLNECAAFEYLLSEELDLRMMDATGDMDEMREGLRERLNIEKGLVDIIDLITHSSKNIQVLVLTTKSIPCILHSEIQIAINILKMIFSTGIDGHDTQWTNLNLVMSWLKFSTRTSWDQQPIGHSGSFPSLTKENQNQVSWDGSRLVICVCRVLKSRSSLAILMLSSRNVSQKKIRTKHYLLLNTTSKPRKS
jgi:hypothetical protein